MQGFFFYIVALLAYVALPLISSIYKDRALVKSLRVATYLVYLCWSWTNPTLKNQYLGYQSSSPTPYDENNKNNRYIKFNPYECNKIKIDLLTMSKS